MRAGAVTGYLIFLGVAVIAQAQQRFPRVMKPTFSPDIPKVSVDTIIVKKKTGPGAKVNDGLTVVRLKAGTDPEAAVKAYRAREDVEYAEMDSVVIPDVIPTDTKWGDLWGLAKINAPQAWDASTGGASVTVCVTDSGVDYNHPDIKPNMHPLIGYNAIAKNNDPMDDYKHGTHVAGIIGAVGNNNEGVVGVNWKVKILACKFIDSNGYGLMSNAISCVNYCAANGARIIQASWSGSGTYLQSVVDAITAAADKGVLFVNSAGNNGVNLDVTPKYPACFNLPNQIVVGSVGYTLERSAFSNFGPGFVNIMAPGETIISTVPNGGYEAMSGTSMATPYVSGAAALVLGASGGTLTMARLKEIILSSSAKYDSLGSFVSTSGFLDVSAALQMYLETTKSALCRTDASLCTLSCKPDNTCEFVPLAQAQSGTSPSAQPPPSPQPPTRKGFCAQKPKQCTLFCKPDSTCEFVPVGQAQSGTSPSTQPPASPQPPTRKGFCSQNPKQCSLKCSADNQCSWVQTSTGRGATPAQPSPVQPKKPQTCKARPAQCVLRCDKSNACSWVFKKA